MSRPFSLSVLRVIPGAKARLAFSNNCSRAFFIRDAEKCSGQLIPCRTKGTFLNLGRQSFVWFSSKSKAGSNGGQVLSRTERRLLERKQRNTAKRKARKPGRLKTIDSETPIAFKFWPFFGQDNGMGVSSLKIQRMQSRLESLVPRVPGRNVSFTHSSLWIALGMRLPLFLILSYLFTNEDIMPYIIEGSLGPSMLPTIQFVGDIWLVETGAWGRIWRRMIDDTSPPLTSLYNVGDLVIWENPHTKKRSCKRIIALEGDTIERLGEYSHLYKHRADDGIIWPKHHVQGETKNNVYGDFSRDASEKSNPEWQTSQQSGHTLLVPNGCVWLEGDCPLFSMDSRQYGPIHTSNLRGRLIFRLWPWSRADLENDVENAYLSSCRISRERPIPYKTIEAYLGNRFNFFRVPLKSRETVTTKPKFMG